VTFQCRKLAGMLAWTAGVSVATAVAGMPAAAADIEVVVTGSNIKRVLSEGALPVQTITREEITKSGAQTAYEILEHVSAVMAYGGFNEALSARQGAATGFAGVSLRGLGIDKTLILLNGRRIANYALARSFPGVDLNSIPTAVVDRVEILLDGASAIYGADAIAGVINFITRKDFSGAEIFGYYASPQDSGGAEARATLTTGYGHPSTDSFNAWLSFDFLNTQGMKATDRPFSNTSYLPSLGVDRTAAQSFPANVAIPGVGTKNPTDPTPNAPSTVLSPVCLPPLSFPTIASPHQCRYDGTPPSNILDPSTRYNVFGRLTWQINPDLLMFGEGSFARNQFTTTTSETPADGLVLPASSPYYPAAWLQANYPAVVGRPLTLSLRTVELGPRSKEATSEQERAVAGLKGAIKGWDFDAAFNYSRSKVSESFTDGWLDLRFKPLFQTGVINPFGPNTPAVLAQMDATTFNGEMQRATSTIQSIDLKTSGDVVELLAGPLALALGGEYRKEDLIQWRAPIYELGQYIGAAAATIPTMPPKDRTVGSLFAEAYVPIVKNLEAQAAIRYDNYSDFGSTTDWKLALRWQPTRQVLFRGSWSTGFHAPSLLELYQPLFLTGTLTPFSDPLRCPVTQSSSDCNRSFQLQRGGDPALLPETSKQWSLGLVLDPVEGMTMTFDWFRIELQDLLAQRSESFLGGAMSDPNSPYVHRGPIDPLYAALPGPVDYLIGQTQNLGRKLVEGIDVDITARSPTSSLGMLTARLNGTYLTQYRQSQDDGSFPNIVGTRGDVGSIPRWKHVLTLDWMQGPWNATLIENFTQSYIEACLAGDSSGCTKRKVAAYEIWDLSGGYTGFANTTLRLGIKNIANRDPPVSNQTLTGNIGYDPSYADPRGRTFYGSVRYAFR
jgi:iron complex outermembrane recepter protein